MTNFVTCCKFVKKGLSKRESLATEITPEEFSRTVGNIYAQSWLKQEPIFVDENVRPDVSKFIRQMSTSISNAQITFESDVKKEPPDIQPMVESKNDGSPVFLRSKTSKPLQSVLVLSSGLHRSPESVKKEPAWDNGNGDPYIDGTTILCKPEEPGSSGDVQIKVEHFESGHHAKTNDAMPASETVAEPEPGEIDCSGEIEESSKLTHSHSNPDYSTGKHTDSGAQVETKLLEDDADTDRLISAKNAKKDCKKKHKKHSKDHKRDRSEKRERKRSRSKSVHTRSHSRSQVKVKREVGLAPPPDYDPLNPAPNRDVFPLPAGMDEGEIYSDKSEDEHVVSDLTSFTNTSPEEFAGIVSSLNKFYSTAVLDEDEYLNIAALAENDSDEEDLEIRDYDSLIIAGKVESEGDVCGVDVYVYNREEEELFVHHDYFLPAFPLALEWLDYNSHSPNKKGNLVAIGSVKSEIEIWPVDSLGAIQPLYKLGAPKGILRNARIAETLSGHSGAVTSLSWNHIIRKGLASGSVDNTVAFWDLEKCDCLAVFNHHEAQVSSVAFHPVEPYLLASSGFDKKVFLTDLSTQDQAAEWELSAQVEKILWSGLSVNQLYAAQANGNIACLDLRFTSQLLYEFKAHSKGVTAIAEDKFFPGCLVTVSEDSHLKVWNLTDHCPVCIKDKNMKMGILTTVDACPSNPFVYCVGGQSCGIRVVDFSNKALSQFTENTDGGEF